jgi:hypothetical protein
MLDPSRVYEIQYRISHRHKDGSYGEMAEIAHHDSSQHDPERGWLKGSRIFKCTSCEEYATIVPGAEGGVPERR